MKRNPNIEYRNPKQIRNSKFEFSKLQLPPQSFSCFEFLSFEFVSSFGFLISDFNS